MFIMTCFQQTRADTYYYDADIALVLAEKVLLFQCLSFFLSIGLYVCQTEFNIFSTPLYRYGWGKKQER